MQVMHLREVRMRARRLQKTLHLKDWTINVRWATEEDLEVLIVFGPEAVNEV